MHPWRDLEFTDSPSLVAAYDDVPVWSAAFGIQLLDAVRLRGVQAALDVGCGTGFPLVELAERLGPRARVVGLDPWQHALERAEGKCRERGVRNVETTCCDAEKMPYPDKTFDLVVSNCGFNNVGDEELALGEAWRVAKPGAQLVMTANLPDTMREFYEVFDDLLDDRGEGTIRVKMQEHILAKRKPAAHWCRRLEQAGFSVVRADEHHFNWRFADGTALLRHWFVRLAFLGPWAELVKDDERDEVFLELERRLDVLAGEAGELSLTIPFTCIEATR